MNKELLKSSTINKQSRIRALVKQYFENDEIMLEASLFEKSSRKPSVKQLFEEYARLKASKPSQCIGDKKQSFFRGHLARLHEPRTPAFLALDTIAAWDPHGELSLWTKRFKEKGSKLPDNLNDISHALLSDNYPEYLGERRLELQFVRYIASICAEYSGFWNIRNTLQDIALIGLDLKKVDAIIAECNKPEIIEQGHDNAALIKKVLSGKKTERDVHVAWEWRNVASIDVKLGNIELKHCQYNVWRLGYVKVVCHSVMECYEMLGKLHAAPDIFFVQEYFKDFLGQPSPCGYKAIHTNIDIRKGSFRNRIQVRFIVKQPSSTPLWKTALNNALQQRENLKKNTIRIFTPRHDFRDLPEGSCVLDFVYRVYQGFVGRVEYAIVDNGQHKALLDTLKDQEEVHLVLSKDTDCKLLPSGWEEQVKTSRKRIRHALKSNMEETLKIKGRMRLISQIPELKNVPEQALDWILEVAIEEANEHIFLTQPAYTTDFSWWLRELGIKNLQEQNPQDSPFESFIDSFKENTLISHVQNWLKLALSMPIQDNIQQDLRKGKTAIITCPICNPTHTCKRVLLSQKSTLVFHRKGAKCGKGGVEITTQPRAAVGQYFLFEINGDINGEKNILSRILNILTTQDIRVVEVSSKYLGENWAVIRLEVGLLTNHKAKAALKELRTIDDVITICGPEDPIKPILEETLPPRNVHINHGIPRLPPYTIGGVVKQDHDFYDRSEPLGTLLEAYELQASNKFSASKLFICGPLKTGKTSLAFKFDRTIQKPGNNILPISIYYQAQTRDNWSDVEKQLTIRLRQKFMALYKSGYELAKTTNFKTASLEQLMESGKRLRNGQPIVIVLMIDEIMVPFRKAHDAHLNGDSTELENIRQFASMTHNQFGSLVIWIGPKAPVNSLHIDLQNILRAGEEILIQPFDQKNTTDLLTVSQIWWKYRITIKKYIINDLWRLTGGNPFWLNHLGRKMWDSASQNTTNNAVEFTKEDVHNAVHEILSNDMLFADRVNPEGYYQLDNIPTDYRLILSLLIKKKNEQATHWTDTWISIHEILATYRKHSRNTKKKKLMTILEDMISMGGIIKNGDQIKISAPLLGKWTARHYDF